MKAREPASGADGENGREKPGDSGSGLTATIYAARSGVHYITLDQWARRVRMPRDVYQIRKVARALGCHIEDLLEDDPEPGKE